MAVTCAGMIAEGGTRFQHSETSHSLGQQSSASRRDRKVVGIGIERLPFDNSDTKALRSYSDRMTLTADVARTRYRYDPGSGRLYHTRPGHGRDMGRPIGNVTNGFRYSELLGKKMPTAHAIWLIHHGELPKGILRHLNGDNLDDRIENLAYVRKQLPMSYVHEGRYVSEYGKLPDELRTGIYEIFCVKNSRRYIGSAVRLSHRWRLHYTQLQSGKHHSRHLQRAWNKYGEESFVFRVIEQCSRENLISREQHYIDALCPEFNSRPNASSQDGFKFSIESRRKMSASRPKNFSPMKGKRHTEETKRKISEKKKGVKQSPESVAKRASSLRARLGNTKNCQFTVDQILDIRTRCNSGESNNVLSVEYCVSNSVISQIKNRRSYRWVA
jgi:group I intron endonuclease